MKKLFSLALILSVILTANSQQKSVKSISNINGIVKCSDVDTSTGYIYIGGYLPDYNNLAVSIDGGYTFRSFANVNDTVSDLKIFKNQLFITGKFTTVNSIANKWFSKLSLNGTSVIINGTSTLIPSLQSGSGDGTVTNYATGLDIQINNDTLYVCGTFKNPTQEVGSLLIYNNSTNTATSIESYYYLNNVQTFWNIQKLSSNGVNLMCLFFTRTGYMPSTKYNPNSLLTTSRFEINGIFSNIPSVSMYSASGYNKEVYIYGSTSQSPFTKGLFSSQNTFNFFQDKITSSILNNTEMYLGGNYFLKKTSTFASWFTADTLAHFNGCINTMFKYDGDIFIAGNFTQVDGRTITNFCKYTNKPTVVNVIEKDTIYNNINITVNVDTNFNGTVINRDTMLTVINVLSDTLINDTLFKVKTINYNYVVTITTTIYHNHITTGLYNNSNKEKIEYTLINKIFTLKENKNFNVYNLGGQNIGNSNNDFDFSYIQSGIYIISFEDGNYVKLSL